MIINDNLPEIKRKDLPTKLSDLTNDQGFIDNTVANLTNYYTKSQTLTKEEISTAIQTVNSFNVQIVSELPTTGTAATIYLVLKTDVEDKDIYNEYIYLSNRWEKLGDTSIDLSNYYNKTVIDALLLNKADTAAIPTKVSQLSNDSNYATKSEIPVIYDWAKEASKPSYSYNEITGKPTLFSGDYDDLVDRPDDIIKTITEAKVNAWDAMVAGSFSGNYNDLTNKPTIPTRVSQLVNDENYVKDRISNVLNLPILKGNYSYSAIENYFYGYFGNKQTDECFLYAVDEGNVITIAGSVTKQPSFPSTQKSPSVLRINLVEPVAPGNYTLQINSLLGDGNALEWFIAFGDQDTELNSSILPSADVLKRSIWESEGFNAFNSYSYNINLKKTATCIYLFTEYNEKDGSETAFQISLSLGSGVGIWESIDSIPRMTSQLINNSGFLTSYTETDPTVPAWAKAATKPEYKYSEITEKPTLAAVATSGSYIDLADKPVLGKAALSNKYSDLDGLPDLSGINPDEELRTNYVHKDMIGAADGVASLDSTGRVPTSQLPSYVDDVLNITDASVVYSTLADLPSYNNEGRVYLCINAEQTNEADLEVADANTWKKGFLINENTELGKWAFKIPLESHKIYIDIKTNKTYRYTMATENHMVEISSSLAIGETADSAFAGDRGVALEFYWADAAGRVSSVEQQLTSFMDQVITEETDPTVPEWAKQTSKPTYTYEEITGAPTKVSDLTNDSGFITNADIPNIHDWALAEKKPDYEYSEIKNTPTKLSEFANDENFAKKTDIPSVPNWALAADKPVYKYSEIQETPTIPVKLSDLTNDSGFITNTVSNLVNYYTKDNTYTREEINNAISAIPRFGILVVESLPTTNISSTTIYLVSNDQGENNIFTEYIYSNGKWEKLGLQTLDLANYVQKSDLVNGLTAGLAKVNSEKGITATEGVLETVKATDAEIEAKTSNHAVITPSNLEKAVRTIIPENYYLKTADVATEEVAGVIKAGPAIHVTEGGAVSLPHDGHYHEMTDIRNGNSVSEGVLDIHAGKFSFSRGNRFAYLPLTQVSMARGTNGSNYISLSTTEMDEALFPVFTDGSGNVVMWTSDAADYEKRFQIVINPLLADGNNERKFEGWNNTVVDLKTNGANGILLDIEMTTFSNPGVYTMVAEGVSLKNGITDICHGSINFGGSTIETPSNARYIRLTFRVEDQTSTADVILRGIQAYSKTISVYPNELVRSGSILSFDREKDVITPAGLYIGSKTVENKVATEADLTSHETNFQNTVLANYATTASVEELAETIREEFSDGIDSCVTSRVGNDYVNKVYVINAEGDDDILDVDSSALENAVVKRDENGQIIVVLTPTADNHATSKKFVETKIGEVSDDLDTFALRINGQIAGIDSTVSGHTESIALINQTMVTQTQLETRGYATNGSVDTKVADSAKTINETITGIDNRLTIAEGTLTGQAGTITNLTGSVATQTANITNLQTTTTNQGNSISDHSTRIQTLEAEVAELKGLIGAGTGLKTEVLEFGEELPETGEAGTVYMVPVDEEKTSYTEYLWMTSTSKFERIGSTSDVNLDGYVTTDAMNTALSGKMDSSVAAQTYYTKEEIDLLLAGKADKTDGVEVVSLI